jgi:hypothetical protein
LKLVAADATETPASATAEKQGDDDSDSDNTLAVIALVVGGVGVLLGAVALVRGRARPPVA